MAEMDLETIQLLEAARRASQSNLTERLDALTEVMARFLHYQDSGEPNWSVVNESSSLPQVIIDRYRNDVKFHSQVTRAVAAILDINRRSLRRDAGT